MPIPADGAKVNEAADDLVVDEIRPGRIGGRGAALVGHQRDGSSPALWFDRDAPGEPTLCEPTDVIAPV